MKIVFQLLILLSFATSVFGNTQKAIGKGQFLQTYSRVMNILSERNAETLALSNALTKVVKVCGGETFDIQATQFSNSLNRAFVEVSCTLEYNCH